MVEQRASTAILLIFLLLAAPATLGQQAPLPTTAATTPAIEMRIVPASRIIWPSAVILVLGLAFIALVRRNRLIRAVSATTPASAPAPEIPYSLGRTQMAVWFFLVGASYLFIWAATGDLNVLSASELVLLGIAGGTALSAVVIEGNPSVEKLDKRRRDIEAIHADIRCRRHRARPPARPHIRVCDVPAFLPGLPAADRGLRDGKVGIARVRW